MGGSIPQENALRLAGAAGAQIFIETGTYKGATAIWAANHFRQVFTIEGFRPRFEKTKAAWEGLHANLDFMLGDSRHVLPQLLMSIREPVLFWLDAHWVGDSASAFEQEDECPIREELEAINAHALAARHIILIDDARLFQNPPPYPHHPEQWPDIKTLTGWLTAHPRSVTIKDDVIYTIPQEVKIRL